MTTESQYKSWSQTGPDGTAYLCSTDPELIDLGALNAALGSDMLWWANALAEDRLKKMVDNCLILGLISSDRKLPTSLKVRMYWLLSSPVLIVKTRYPGLWPDTDDDNQEKCLVP